MRKLYHFWLCPFSRKLRIVLAEKELEFELIFEKYWDRRSEFLRLNPAGQVPVLIEDQGAILPESSAVCEYLEEMYPTPSLFGHDPEVRAETRRLTAWFDLKFYEEVTRPLVEEKVLKRFMGMGQPDSEAMRVGRVNMRYHLDYIGWLAEHRNWLVADSVSLADIAAAAHLSCLDYIGDVPWDDYEAAKNWYVRLKSRPSFRPLLADNIQGLSPPQHYSDLDF